MKTKETSNVAVNAKGEPVIPTEIMKYKHKTKDKVGVLVHNGITKTLKFEDGTESILSPANFKRYWELLSVEPKPEVPNVEPSDDVQDDEEATITQVVKNKSKKAKVVTPVEPEEVDVSHLTWKQFKNLMVKHNESSGDEIFGVIVYSQDNFAVEYSEESRSYRVSSKCRAFNHGRGIIGDCLDGSEDNVDLGYAWTIEYCYMPEVTK